MDEKVPELLKLTKKLLDQSMEIVNDSLPETESVPAEEVRYSIFLRVQMSEVLRFGYGAYYSCYHGWGHGGIGAARSIYETLVDIKYINEDEAFREKRIERYVDFAAELICSEMEFGFERGLKISQDLQDKIRSDYDLIIEKYNKKQKQDIASGIEKDDATPSYKRFYWSGLSIASMAEKVNLGEAHKALYGKLSDLSHVSASEMIRSITEFAKNQMKVHFNFHPSDKHCFSVLNVVFLCIYGILEEYMVHFEIESSCYPALQKILEDRGNLENKHKG